MENPLPATITDAWVEVKELGSLNEIEAAVSDEAVEAARRAWSVAMAINNYGEPPERFYNMTGVVAAFRNALYAAQPHLLAQTEES